MRGNMKIFTCENGFEGMMTGIYHAWEWSLQNGKEKVALKREPIRQTTLFDEYVHVEPDRKKAEKVARSIRRKISYNAYITVYYATLSEEDVLDDIYLFLQLGFGVGEKVTSMLTEPCVMKLMEVRRRVGNEAHYWREFTRFDAIGRVLVSHLEPKNHVLPLLGSHFKDRMPSEDWMIIDDRRRLALVHPRNQSYYLRTLSEEEWVSLQKTEQQKDVYQELWKTFFGAITIAQRENKACQRNHIPLWMRKHATEFRK